MSIRVARSSDFVGRLTPFEKFWSYHLSIRVARSSDFVGRLTQFEKFWSCHLSIRVVRSSDFVGCPKQPWTQPLERLRRAFGVAELSPWSR